MNSIQDVLAVGAAAGYSMEQLDADTSFLNSGLKEMAFMEVLLGVKNAKGMICKQEKAIYGLKQAAKAWNTTI